MRGITSWVVPSHPFKFNHQLKEIIMNFASDPLLGTQSSQPSFDAQLSEWAQKFAELQKQKNSFNLQPQQSKTPLWDEIDKVTDSLTETQKNYLNQNKEFVVSYGEIANMLQREYLRITRPMVEQSKDGKEALERHLALIKKLKKNAMQAEEEKTALWNDYINNYSNMTFNDYMVKIKGKKGDKK